MEGTITLNARDLLLFKGPRKDGEGEYAIVALKKEVGFDQSFVKECEDKGVRTIVKKADTKE